MADLKTLCNQILEVRGADGDNLRAKCPFHHSASSYRSLAVNVYTGLWLCYSCGEAGTFASLLRKLNYSPQLLEGIVLEEPADPPSQRFTSSQKASNYLPDYILGSYTQGANPLLNSSFTPEDLKEFEVGFDSKKNQIIFPIRDYLGNLVAISGRYLKHPTLRYKIFDSNLPPNGFGELVGIAPSGYSPKNRDHLYGGHLFYAHCFLSPEKLTQPIVLVEGYKGTIWCKKHGLNYVCGLQGDSLTDAQFHILSRLTGPFCIFLDAEPGKQFPQVKQGKLVWKAKDIAERLEQVGPVLLFDYPEGVPFGTSPDDLSPDQLFQGVTQAKTLTEWYITMNLRQQIQNEREKATTTRKGDRRFSQEELSLEDKEPVKLFIFTPESGEFPIYSYHWPKGGPPKTCTAELEGFDGKCVYCHTHQEHVAANKASKGGGQSPCAPKQDHLVEVLDFRWFHFEGDKDVVCRVEGAVGDPDACPWCANSDSAISNRHFGGRKVWKLRMTSQTSALANYVYPAHLECQEICAAVLPTGDFCGNSVTTASLECKNCKFEFYTERQIRSLKKKDLEAALDQRMKCSSCGTTDYPLQVSACRSGKHEGVRATISNKCVEVTLHLVQRTTSFTYTESTYRVDARKFPLSTPELELEVEGVSEEDGKKALTPIDLKHRYFRPEFLNKKDFGSSAEYVEAVLDKQAAALGRTNPWGKAPATARSPFGGSSGRRFA